ncbi:hypothetical protein, partial [Mesorhizobium sp.]|uniref:hypothetical protein n=1 Tax=Mesorhizobium sp. TaxID=1871066 RepID=UPI0025F76012
QLSRPGPNGQPPESSHLASRGSSAAKVFMAMKDRKLLAIGKPYLLEAFLASEPGDRPDPGSLFDDGQGAARTLKSQIFVAQVFG